jgi:hypothetical protein
MNSKSPILGTGVPVLPTVREKDHVLEFTVAGKKFMSKHGKCSYLYDMDEIMRFGHTRLDQIPEQPALPDFPTQPRPLL